MGTQTLKVSIFSLKGRSPQRHRGCREDVNHFHAAGKVPVGFFFLPRLSFSRTKKKDGVREWHRFNRDAGGTPHTNAMSDRVLTELHVESEDLPQRLKKD